MTALAADLLVLWVAATAGGAGLLALVVLAQGAFARARRRAAARRAAGGRDRVRAGVRSGARPPAAH